MNSKQNLYIVTLQFRSGKCGQVYWRAYTAAAARIDAATTYGAVFAIDSKLVDGNQ